MTFDSGAIVTTDGRKIAISELGPAEEMREKIMRGKLSGFGCESPAASIESAI